MELLNTNFDEKIQAQKTYCKVNTLPLFIPTDGVCFSCHKNIFEIISLKKAMNEHITGCPHCLRTFLD